MSDLARENHLLKLKELRGEDHLLAVIYWLTEAKGVSFEAFAQTGIEEVEEDQL